MLRTITAALMLALAAAPGIAVPRQQVETTDEQDPVVHVDRTFPKHVELPPEAPQPRRAVRPDGHHRHRSKRRTPVRMPLRVARVDILGPSQEARGDVPAGPSGDPIERWRALVASYAWPVEAVLKVIDCESGGNPDATNGRYRGLMQVENGPLDPKTNLDWAYGMWQRFGWSRWDPKCRP